MKSRSPAKREGVLRTNRGNHNLSVVAITLSSNPNNANTPEKLTSAFNLLTKAGFAENFNKFRVYDEFFDHAGFIYTVQVALKQTQFPEECSDRFALHALGFAKACLSRAEERWDVEHTAHLYQITQETLLSIFSILNKPQHQRNLAEAYYLYGVAGFRSIPNVKDPKMQLATKSESLKWLQQAYEKFFGLFDYPGIIKSCKKIALLTPDESVKKQFEEEIKNYSCKKPLTKEGLYSTALKFYNTAANMFNKLSSIEDMDKDSQLEYLRRTEKYFHSAYILFTDLGVNNHQQYALLGYIKVLLCISQYNLNQGDIQSAIKAFDLTKEWSEYLELTDEDRNQIQEMSEPLSFEANTLFKILKSKELKDISLEELNVIIRKYNIVFNSYIKLKLADQWEKIALQLANCFIIKADLHLMNGENELANVALINSQFYFEISHPNQSFKEHLNKSFTTAMKWRCRALQETDSVQIDKCKAYSLKIFQQTVAKGIAFGETDHVIKELEGGCQFQ